MRTYTSMAYGVTAVPPNYSRRRTIKSIGALVVGSTLAGCSGGGGNGGDGDGGGGEETVELTDDLVFDPDELTVSVGTTVVWENVGSVTHTVTAYEDEIPDGATYFASGGADSEQAARDAGTSDGGIEGGESYEHTFETAGTYEYFCIPHEGTGMTGTVTVQE